MERLPDFIRAEAGQFVATAPERRGVGGAIVTSLLQPLNKACTIFGKGIGCPITNNQKLFTTQEGDDQKQAHEGPARARRGGGMTDPGLIILIGLALVMIVTAVSTKLPR
jgi:hypothetical protein